MVKCGSPAQGLAPLLSTPVKVGTHSMGRLNAGASHLGNGKEMLQLVLVCQILMVPLIYSQLEIPEYNPENTIH